MASVDIPAGLEKAIDEEVGEEKVYKNKSELIRDAIRRLLEDKGRLNNRKLSDEIVQNIKEAKESENWNNWEEVKNSQ
ncbi:ribbon-helix-helix domain-containing protein [Candidatus Nanohalobium constans]|uniref:Type II toxin-antitoxin system ParD family antitoxin n=1 Tax=Candidatus Nanohalobium constans TaxID=2565781 RepID=A0A5Q0UFH2_9ARCH|nr:ribbon-helix-helix domain-containing protein [Candidatus Nanohalobium constans]QGA80362.1 type II toxin-antitoxin system ParD family antitoxin [Candidatus Nanohalobium constans]